MTKKALLTLITFIIVLGTIGFALNTLFGLNTVSYITVYNNNGIIMQKYDLWSYIENIRYQFDDISKLAIEVPNLQWNAGNNVYQQMVNGLIQIGKCIIMGLNIMIYPLRIAFYIIGVVLALIGLNMQEYGNNPLNWLITLVKAFIDFYIPQPPQLY